MILIPKATGTVWYLRADSILDTFVAIICGPNLSLVVSVIQEGSSGERAGARLLREACGFPMSQTLCLLDSLSSLQVGILHLSCHGPKDSKSQIQLCCCFPELAATEADCKCTWCFQNVAGRFPTVKELEQTASYFPLESLCWLEGSFRPQHISLLCSWFLHKPSPEANIWNPYSVFDLQHAFMRHQVTFLSSPHFLALCRREAYNNHCYLLNTHSAPQWTVGTFSVVFHLLLTTTLWARCHYFHSP